MRHGFVALLALIVLSRTTLARDIYVDNQGGDDRNNGAAPNNAIAGGGPCRTIARALRTASKGDRIILANNGVPYREAVSISGGRFNGLPGQPFQIIGNGATLDGSIPVPPDCWEFYRGAVFRFLPRDRVYQQLFLDDLPAKKVDAPRTEPFPKLKPLEWCHRDGYIYFCVEDQRLPADYNLTYAARRVGITLYAVSGVEISDLTVQGFQLDGINAHDSVFDSAIVSVRARGNGRSGVSVGGASRVTVEASLIGNNGAAQVRCEGYSRTDLIDCDILDNTAPKVVKQDRARVTTRTSSTK